MHYNYSIKIFSDLLVKQWLFPRCQFNWISCIFDAKPGVLSYDKFIVLPVKKVTCEYKWVKFCLVKGNIVPVNVLNYLNRRCSTCYDSRVLLRRYSCVCPWFFRYWNLFYAYLSMPVQQIWTEWSSLHLCSFCRVLKVLTTRFMAHSMHKKTHTTIQNIYRKSTAFYHFFFKFTLRY